MYIELQRGEQRYRANLAEPLDISIPLRAGMDTVNCFYAPPIEVTPVVAGNFIGATAQGGPVNFFNVKINPHGNGTHTECVGHIAKAPYTIHQSLQNFHFFAKLVSIYPQKTVTGDRVLLPAQIKEALGSSELPAAVIIRTLPNDDWKLRTNYSGVNPPYLHPEAVQWLVAQGVQHLLIDLPSVDREEDGGQLAAHRAFWQYPEQPRENCTITELIYIRNFIKDALYLLNIQIASFEIDVSPSKPVLYQLQMLP
ncbi:MAG TPA: cyclase family protein [Saprospiraceae bacterium]|nr:cyclase family protein [Saprospiraceae bacterium]HMP23487.1 cyclase family protein [Saprospiraceae bacterium]